jgi:hypothetical protein
MGRDRPVRRSTRATTRRSCRGSRGGTRICGSWSQLRRRAAGSPEQGNGDDHRSPEGGAYQDRGNHSPRGMEVGHVAVLVGQSLHNRIDACGIVLAMVLIRTSEPALPQFPAKENSRSAHWHPGVQSNLGGSPPSPCGFIGRLRSFRLFAKVSRSSPSKPRSLDAVDAGGSAPDSRTILSASAGGGAEPTNAIRSRKCAIPAATTPRAAARLAGSAARETA